MNFSTPNSIALIHSDSLGMFPNHKPSNFHYFTIYFFLKFFSNTSIIEKDQYLDYNHPSLKIGMASSGLFALIGKSLLHKEAHHIFFCPLSMPVIFGRGFEQFLFVFLSFCRNNPHFSPINVLSLRISREKPSLGYWVYFLPSLHRDISPNLDLYYCRVLYGFLPFSSIP